MWKNASKMLQLCKELMLPQSNASVEVIAEHIYKKYFEERVRGEVRVEKNGNEKQFCHLLHVHTNQDQIIAPTADDVWIFGYGSLVWKADFPYIDRRRGFICGYQRRFYQHSIDHRGTHAHPGRVVTLLPTGGELDRVYGVAYRIAYQQKSEVLEHLDYREKNGYERCTLKFHEFPEAVGANFDIIMYIATPENDSYAGHIWQLPRIAEQIFATAGSSGPNRDYLFNLANAMRELFPGVDDEHLFELEKEVRRLIENEEATRLERALKKEITNILALLDRNDTEKEYDEGNLAVKRLEALQSRCTKIGWKEMLLTKELSS